jgi:hypothetical protein
VVGASVSAIADIDYAFPMLRCGPVEAATRASRSIFSAQTPVCRTLPPLAALAPMAAKRNFDINLTFTEAQI